MGAISGCGCLLFPQPKSSCRCLPTAQTPRPHVLFPSTVKATRERVQCIRSQSPNSDEDDSKAVLDAFFIGKAFAEALTERVESTVGEFLSVIGQWQAEQQKQVEDFQMLRTQGVERFLNPENYLFHMMEAELQANMR